jgi:alkylhydroperoxidase family enzyme
MWIKHVKEPEATGYVSRVYRSTSRRGGEIDNIIQAHSLNPNALRALMSFYNGVMHGDCAISLRRREMIAVTVSRINDCHY